MERCFFFYLVWYSVGRFFVEGLRTDSLMLSTSLRMAQVISIGMIVLAMVLFIYRRFILKVHTRYND